MARRQYEVWRRCCRDRRPSGCSSRTSPSTRTGRWRSGWGRGVFTTPARVAATAAFVLLGSGRRAAHCAATPRGSPTPCSCCSSAGRSGVAAYLNLKAGSSLGWGVIPDSAPHEARERDYFFVLGFWAWGCLVGYGALARSCARVAGPAPLALLVLVVPLVGNWQRIGSVARAAGASARVGGSRSRCSRARRSSAVLFVAGDNDSYPLWYAQQVGGDAPRRHARDDLAAPRRVVSGGAAAPDRAALGRRASAGHARWQHEQVAVTSRERRAALRAVRSLRHRRSPRRSARCLAATGGWKDSCTSRGRRRTGARRAGRRSTSARARLVGGEAQRRVLPVTPPRGRCGRRGCSAPARARVLARPRRGTGPRTRLK